jgi:Methyltransferase domain
MIPRKLRGRAITAISDVLDRAGYDVVHRQFDSPIPDATELGSDFWTHESDLVGVSIDERNALRFLENVVVPTLPEFRAAFPLHGAEARQFWLVNGSFMAGDAHVYWAILRRAPRRVFEIGAGNSTVLAATAAVRNRADGHETEVVAIDPYPRPALQGLDGLSRLLPQKVQDVDPELFLELDDGDVLFIDSSHVLRMGGDVEAEYLEILPRLRPGVFVHVHDINLPRQYQRTYFDSGTYWNEQALLQAFLAFNSRFEVVWPGAFMALRHSEALEVIRPELDAMNAVYPDAVPSSFWMRVRS